MPIDETMTQSKRAAVRPGIAVDPLRVRRALLSHKRSLLFAGLGGLIVGFALAKFAMTSSYESTAVIRFEGTTPIQGMPPSYDAVKTKAAELGRQAVLGRLADEIGFEGNLSTVRTFFGYDVDARAGTVRIMASGDTGKDAAEFAKTVVDVFVRYHEDQQAKRIETEIGRVTKRIAASEDEVNRARRKYDEFRNAHGIADLSTEQESTLEQAARLRAEGEMAVSEVRALEAQVQSLEAQLASTPKTRTIIGGASPERDTYQRLRQELATARATLSESHPRVQALREQVAQMRASGAGTRGGDGQVGANATHLAIEEQLRTAKSNLAALRERQTGLLGLADKAQQRVEAFSEIEGEASGLLADVKVNEALVQGLSRTQAALEDALANPSSGFVILDPGSVPEYPIRNKMKLVVFVAMPALFFGLALFFALWREFRGLRVLTPAEVAFWGRGAVLGTTSWPNDRHGLEELVAGLDDYIPDAVGSVLIVGGSPDETPLAIELADRMNDDWVVRAGIPGASSAAPQSVRETATLTPLPRSGPYPVSRSVALVRRPSVQPIEALAVRHEDERLKLEAWDGVMEGQALRRAARLADRVVVLVHSGTLSAIQLNDVRRQLGREDGVGYILVGLPEELLSLPDRVGDVSEFWRSLV